MSSSAMALAVATAEKSDHVKWKLGSVVWRGGSVLSTACNRIRNDPDVVEDSKYFLCTVHSEVAAIKAAGDVSGAKLFVARRRRDGGLGLAKPCGRCMKVIRESGVRRVFYTDASGSWARLKVNG